LPAIYGRIVIPPAVHAEVTVRGIGVAELAQATWLHVQRPRDAAAVRTLSGVLDPGEAEAVPLAVELHALMLIDDRRARRRAAQMHVACLGTVGIVLEAKDTGLIDAVGPLLHELVDAGVYLDAALIVHARRVAGEGT